jgi:hypothetical protein
MIALGYTLPAFDAAFPAGGATLRPMMDARVLASWASLASLLVVSSARAEGAADPGGEDGILSDLERIVTAEESSGWFLDATHLTALYPVLLQTVCQATPEARQGALAKVEAYAAMAGDPRALFARDGRLSTAAERALSQQRQLQLLRLAVDGSARDCPFWIEPRQGFRGRQTYQRRWFLSFESGGLLQLRRTMGGWTYGGGGVGRLLGGYGLHRRLSVLAGAEFAGGAMLRPGGEKNGFVINYFSALPVLLRLHGVSWHYDLEGAFVSMFQADNTSFSHGARVGAAVGVSALRTRFFIPWAGAAIAFEHYFEGGGRASQQFLRAGLRVGAVWGPLPATRKAVPLGSWRVRWWSSPGAPGALASGWRARSRGSGAGWCCRGARQGPWSGRSSSSRLARGPVLDEGAGAGAYLPRPSWLDPSGGLGACLLGAAAPGLLWLHAPKLRDAALTAPLAQARDQ